MSKEDWTRDGKKLPYSPDNGSSKQKGLSIKVLMDLCIYYSCLATYVLKIRIFYIDFMYMKHCCFNNKAI